MKIHKLNCGILYPLNVNSLVNKSAESLSEKLPFEKFFKKGLITRIKDSNRLKQFFTFICKCLLIEVDGDLILIDAGFSQRDFSDPVRRIPKDMLYIFGNLNDREDQSAKTQILKLGYKLTDVKHLIITHLDFDHVAGIEDFPSATIHVCDWELQAGEQQNSFLEKKRYYKNFWNFHEKIKPFEISSETWSGFNRGKITESFSEKIFPVLLPGHTRGHCGVVIENEKSTLLFTADAYMHSSQLDPNRKKDPIYTRLYRRVFQVNLEQAQRTMDQLRDLRFSLKEPLEFINSHDVEELKIHGC